MTRAGAAAVCPECGKPLTDSGNSKKAAVAGIFLLLIAAGAAYKLRRPPDKKGLKETLQKVEQKPEQKSEQIDNSPIEGQPDWVIELKDRFGSRLRKVIGKSAYKLSWWNGEKPQGDTIADFAAGVVIQVDHEKKTVARTALEDYLKREAANNPPLDYSPFAPGNYGGLPCDKWSYSYSSGSSVPGGWGGGRGCFTSAIGMPSPYGRQFMRWLQVTERFKGNLGVSLWYESQAGGPWFLAEETVRATHRRVPPSEFQPPAGYRTVDFNWTN